LTKNPKILPTLSLLTQIELSHFNTNTRKIRSFFGLRGSRRPFKNRDVFNSEIFSCCPEHLAATKANQSYFQSTIIFLALITTGQTKGCSFLRNYFQIVPQLSNSGTTVALSTAV
jgi:hypothetical protein